MILTFEFVILRMKVQSSLWNTSITREGFEEKRCGFIFSILCYTPIFLIHIFYIKGNGDHSEVRDKFCSNFQNMLIRSL